MADSTTRTLPGTSRRLPALRDPLWLLILAIACGFFLNLGGAPLFDRDEGAFSEATREMFDRGDFVSTYLNGKPRYDKPILIYWCQAAFVAVLGPREVAFRLPSAIFAALWVIALVRFLSPRLGRDTALAAGTFMATALGIMMIGRAAIADALLNCLLALALFDLFRWCEAPTRATHVRFFLWMALGVLTKGPVAVLIPGAVSTLYLGSLGRWRDWLRLVFFPLGIAVFLAVALPWYIAQYRAEGDAFLRGFFLKHNVERFAAPMEGHRGSFLYYFVVFPLAVLPGTALLLRMLPRARAWRRDPLDRFCWLWMAFVLVFFTVASTKLPHYVYLGITPLFVLMARYRDDLRSRFLALLPAFALLLLVGALPWIVPMVRARLHDPQATAMLAGAAAVLDPGYVAACAMALTVLVALAGTGSLRPWRAIQMAGITLAILLAEVVVPAAGALMQGPVKAAARLSRDLDVPVVMWGLDHPSIAVYRRQATPDRRPEPGEACITKTGNLAKLPGARVLFQRGGIVLVTLPD